jgi:ribosomal protein S3AE
LIRTGKSTIDADISREATDDWICHYVSVLPCAEFKSPEQQEKFESDLQEQVRNAVRQKLQETGEENVTEVQQLDELIEICTVEEAAAGITFQLLAQSW